MDKIVFENVMPDVFAQRSDVMGDVWGKHVEFEKGNTYLIEANSGTGKSSLCSFVYGYRRDYQGRILFDGVDSKDLRIKEWVDLRRRHLSLLWQDLRLFPELTALENVRIKNKLTGFLKRSHVDELFEALGISDKRDSLVGLMSFGQQQRVALIRALCQPFDFIFVDEPISHLDDSNSDILSSILLEEARRQGAAVVATSIGRRLSINYDKVFQL